MKKNTWALLSLFASITVLFSSCEIVGGIFKAGMWTSVIIIAIIVAIVIFIFSKLRSKK